MVILIVTVVMVADDGVHLLLCELYTRSLVAVLTASYYTQILILPLVFLPLFPREQAAA